MIGLPTRRLPVLLTNLENTLTPERAQRWKMMRLRGHAFRTDRCECGARPPVTLKVSSRPWWHRLHKAELLDQIRHQIPE